MVVIYDFKTFMNVIEKITAIILRYFLGIVVANIVAVTSVYTNV